MLSRIVFPVFAVVAVALVAPAEAQQSKDKPHDVSTYHALGVTKEVLTRQGYDVVRVEEAGGDRVVYYRRGNMGNGKGKGPVERLVIHQVDHQVVFVDTPATILSAIVERLKLP